MRQVCPMCGRRFTGSYEYCWACHERLKHADDWPGCKECQRYYERGFMAGLTLRRSLGLATGMARGVATATAGVSPN
jgi:predicted amidophosphoribosyltransferase